MTLLLDMILMGHESVGSFALSSSKTNLAIMGVGAIKQEIEDTLNRDLVPKLMRINGLSTTNMPQYRLGDVESPDLVELGDFIVKMANSGFQMFPTVTGEREREVLRLANLPQSDVETITEA